MLDPNSAVAYALSVSRWRASGLCLEFVDHCFGQPGSKLGDNGGPPNGAWQNAKDGYYYSRHQHPGDMNPPAGVPCYWETGPSGNPAGHIVVSLGGGLCRTTDYAGAASVSTASIASITRARNGGYLGWTEDFGGNLINLGTNPAPAPSPAPTEQGEIMARVILRQTSGVCYTVAPGFIKASPDDRTSQVAEDSYGTRIGYNDEDFRRCLNDNGIPLEIVKQISVPSIGGWDARRGLFTESDFATPLD